MILCRLLVHRRPSAHDRQTKKLDEMVRLLKVGAKKKQMESTVIHNEEVE